MPQSSKRERALLRSQSGPVAGMSLSAVPSSFLTRIESQLFRVLLLRRLRLPLPLSSRSCRCGRLSDIFGHHGASCAQAGVLGWCGFAKSLWTDSFCTDGPSSPWTPRSCQCYTVMGHQTEAQLMRMGSFWWQPDAGRNEPSSEETIAFIRHLAKARAREEPFILRKRAEQGWRMRWCSLLACAAARAFAASLLAQRTQGSVDGETPNVHSVLCGPLPSFSNPVLWYVGGLCLGCARHCGLGLFVGRGSGNTCVK